jgi:hypothetical protein
MRKHQINERAIILAIICCTIALVATFDWRAFNSRPDPKCQASQEECMKLAESSDRKRAKAIQRAMMQAAY